MMNFEQVCAKLKEVVSMDGAPDYELGRAIPFDPETNVHGKLQKFFKNWEGQRGGNGTGDRHVVGSCEVGNFTGNQLIRIICDLLRRNSLKEPGKYIDFLVNKKLCFALLFGIPGKGKANPIVPREKGREKKLFDKIFDEDFVQRNKGKNVGEEYGESRIRHIRKEAAKEYPIFLKTKLAEYGPKPKSFAFLYPFIGLLADLASCNCRANSETDPIPYAAVIKLAFDHDGNSGKVTKLFKKATTTSQQLIKAALPCENEIWEEAAIQKVAEEIRELYKIED